jgi:hypothetical protein
MKFLFKVIFLPILITLALPLTFLALAYKDVAIPMDDYDFSETVELSDMINEQIDVFLQDNNETSKVDLRFNQKQMNGLVLTALRAQNEFYLSDDAPSDDLKNYVVKEGNYALQGAWVRMKDQTIEIEVGIHVFLQDITYRTRLLLGFELVADTSEVVLTLETITLGNIPLAWTFGIANWVTGLVSGFDVDAFVNKALGEMATFSLSERELRIDVEHLIDEALSEDPDTQTLVKGLIAFVEENELIDIGVNETGLGLSINLGKLSDSTEPFILDDALKIIDQDHLTAILTTRATGVLFTALDAQSGYPYLDLDDVILNRIFEFMLREQLSSSGIVEQTELFENYTLKVLVPYVTMDEDFIVNVPLVFEKIGEPDYVFKTILKLSASPSVENQDLLIDITGFTVGEVSMDDSNIQNILSLIGDTDFIQNGQFVIRNFNQQFEQTGIEIVAVAMVNNKLRLSIDVSSSLPVSYEVIQDIINDVVNQVTSELEGITELEPVQEAFDNVIGSLTDEEIDTAVAIEQLIETIEQLNQEDRDELLVALQTVFNNLNPEDYDLGEDFNFDDLFNFFGN